MKVPKSFARFALLTADAKNPPNGEIRDTYRLRTIAIFVLDEVVVVVVEDVIEDAIESISILLPPPAPPPPPTVQFYNATNAHKPPIFFPPTQKQTKSQNPSPKKTQKRTNTKNPEKSYS